MRTLLALLILLPAAAGCINDASQPVPPENALTVRAGSFPVDVVAGQPIDLEVAIDGPGRIRSEHVDVHFATTEGVASVEAYPGSCARAEGDLPGRFTIRCVFPEPGRIHLRGHAQLDGEGGPQDYWGPDQELYVQPADPPPFLLSLIGAPPNATAGQPFDLELVVEAQDEGPATLEAVALEVLAANASSEEGSLAHYRHTCHRRAATVPGTYQVTCSLPSEGPWSLRSHLRLLVSGEEVDYWSPEVTVEVEPFTPPGYELSVVEAPEEVQAGQPFDVTLRIQDGPPRQAQRVDVRHGPTSQGNGSYDAYPGVCDASPAPIPGDVTLTCTVDEVGDRFLRGHMLLRVGNKLVPYWSPEVQLTVH